MLLLVLMTDLLGSTLPATSNFLKSPDKIISQPKLARQVIHALHFPFDSPLLDGLRLTLKLRLTRQPTTPNRHRRTGLSVVRSGPPGHDEKNQVALGVIPYLGLTQLPLYYM